MTATVNDRTCTSARAWIPRYGNCRVSLSLGDAELLPTTGGAVTVVVSGVTIRGTVEEQAVRAGRLGAEIVGGFGGWELAAPVQRTPARPQADRADNGVKLGTFAAALAADVGEVIEVLAIADRDRALGVTVPRMGGESAASVLSLACASPAGSAVVPWWMRPADAVTMLGSRTGPAVDPEVLAVDAGPTDQWRSFALIDASVLLPGATIEGRTIEELVITATGDAGTQVVGLAAEETLWSTFRRAVLTVIGPRVAAARIYRYQVIGFEADGRLRALPRRASLAPILPGLPLWPGVAGHRARPQVGSDILVQFADGDPGFPVVVGFQPALAGGVGIPTLIELDAAAIRLAGTTPIALRGSLAGKLAFDALVPALYYQAVPLGPYVSVASTVGPPLPAFLGTDVVITTGSSVVSAAE